MGFYAGIHRAYRGRTHILQPRGRGADQDGFVRQGTFRNFSFQQVAGRNIGIGAALRAAGASERDEHGQPLIHGHSHAARAVYQNYAFQRVMGAERSRRRKARLHGGPAHHGAKHGQSQRLVILALVFGQQRQTANDTIAVADGVEEPSLSGSLIQFAEIGSVTIPGGGCQRPAAQLGASHHRQRERTLGVPLPITGEVVAQHRRMPLKAAREQGIVVEGRSQTSQLLGKARSFGQGPSLQGAQGCQPGAVVGLGKHHIEAHHRHTLACEQFSGQVCEFVSAPGPAPDAIDALFIDVHNDDALVKGSRHPQAQAGVVDELVQPLQQRQGHGG